MHNTDLDTEERAARLRLMTRRFTTQPSDFAFEPTADFDTAAYNMQEHLKTKLRESFWGRMAMRFISSHVIRDCCYALYNIARSYAVPLHNDDRAIYRQLLDDHASMTTLENITGNVQIYKLPSGHIRIFGKGNLVLLGEGINMRQALLDYEVRAKTPAPQQELELEE